MITLPLMAATIAISLIGLAILCVVATQQPELLPATGSMFAQPTMADPTAETFASARSDGTLAGDWQELELSNLSAVEDVLDNLETHHVRQREMAIAGDDKFIVRWR